ncbi:CDP-glucose 4,6-dehydratase [Mucilaginibacter flavus]|uniref:CDP-glucose 4,6-dehydratase n=1 Tax=Mucilaginibacter flavus TaxID=931504 RepID=UPI0025B57D40|nr:CDP-glucose 4,6-dehydratase [Mucilaginibacter flavus]MDN3582824.1 CDP-glucose 4,6-dehydratase [Mucilaginibacter flavus]
MFNYLKEIYNGKKVFVTGHTGFKGAWLLKVLNLLGAEVMGYALAPQNEHDLYYTLNGDTLCESVIADLRNRDELKKAVLGFNPDFIFHLAAQPLVRLSYQIPAETFEVNAIGTANLLDALAELNKPCSAVLITTDKVYHNNEWDYPYRENDRLGGYDPYSASKACAELVIDSYRNSFFNISSYHRHQKAIAVGRAGNVIGGGDWAKDRLIPDVIRALSADKPVEIRNPDAVRPWQHVLEPLGGYLLLGAKLAAQPELFSQAYNFGPDVNDVLSVHEMTVMATKAWGNGSFEVKKNANQPHEAGLLKLDISKARAQLNWVPQLDATRAVEFTIAWYKKFHENSDVAKYTEEQILNYFDV